jgi:hypothetical protein
MRGRNLLWPWCWPWTTHPGLTPSPEGGMGGTGGGECARVKEMVVGGRRRCWLLPTFCNFVGQKGNLSHRDNKAVWVHGPEGKEAAAAAEWPGAQAQFGFRQKPSKHNSQPYWAVGAISVLNLNKPSTQHPPPPAPHAVPAAPSWLRHHLPPAPCSLPAAPADGPEGRCRGKWTKPV